VHHPAREHRACGHRNTVRHQVEPYVCVQSALTPSQGKEGTSEAGWLDMEK
jgi:hypothetical protein